MAKRKNPPQTKADIAARFNKRIDTLVTSGVDPALLPDKIDDVSIFTHRELRKLASAAAKKNSEGFYTSGKVSLPKIRKTYQNAMLDIINERRAKRKKAAGNIETTAAGKKTGLKRAEMGDIRANQLKPLKKDRPFRSQRDEDYFLKSLPKMLENERDKIFIENIIVALKKTFGDKANNLIAVILKTDPKKVIRAYYQEELFDIQTIYLESEEYEEEYINVLKRALFDQGAERARYTEKQKTAVDELVKRSLDKEKLELIDRMF